MGLTVAAAAEPDKKVTLASVAVRLADRYGESPATWENRMHGATSDFAQCARIVAMLLELGRFDKVVELMAPIDRVLEHVAREADAENREKDTDLSEDVAQRAYERNPSPETARALLRARAVMRRASIAHDEEIAALHGLTL